MSYYTNNDPKMNRVVPFTILQFERKDNDPKKGSGRNAKSSKSTSRKLQRRKVRTSRTNESS